GGRRLRAGLGCVPPRRPPVCLQVVAAWREGQAGAVDLLGVVRRDLSDVGGLLALDSNVGGLVPPRRRVEDARTAEADRLTQRGPPRARPGRRASGTAAPSGRRRRSRPGR